MRRESARRLRGTIGCVFRHAVATLKARYDPTAALRSALLRLIVNLRAAITDERDLGALTLTCRQPSSGANTMNKLATPLRSYS
jgi:hypothetical protein